MDNTLVVHRPPRSKLHSLDYTRHRIYLSGSMIGVDWQSRFIKQLEPYSFDVFNPRYPSCHIANNPKDVFEWELDHMSIANVIAFYFDPFAEHVSNTSLIALGMYAKTDKVIVCCPEDFPRKDDIDALCVYENVAQVDSLDTLINTTITRLSPYDISRYWEAV